MPTTTVLPTFFAMITRGSTYTKHYELTRFQPKSSGAVVPVNDGNFAKFDDLNQDGRSDIVIEGDGNRGLRVARRQAVGAGSLSRISTAIGQFTTGDYDLDGRKELITGNSNGSIYAFECAGQDSYALQCSIPFYPNEIESYGFGSARDMRWRARIHRDASRPGRRAGLRLTCAFTRNRNTASTSASGARVTPAVHRITSV